MPNEVKRDLRAARRSDTESRLVEAATELFVEHGYVATTLADVAERAGVAPRTVYVRFATKAALFQRCLDLATRGDRDDVPVPDQDAFRAATTASTRDERIARMASLGAQLMARTGPLMFVAQQAEAVEPEIAVRLQAARTQTQQAIEGFWRAMAHDGLLPKRTDVDWLATAAALLGQPETFLLGTKTRAFDAAAYEAWLVTTWGRLVAAASVKG